jgi:ABC-2 type transport system ATP-binding protein
MNTDWHKIIEILPFAGPLFLLEVGLLALALVDLVQRKKVRGDNKVLWIVIIVIFSVIGPIVYFVFGRKEEVINRPVSVATPADGSFLSPASAPRRTGSAGPAIKTENLGKKYGTVTALDNLNLEIPENVVFGFLGPNGAGKTTTVRLLTGFAQPTAGQATVAGEAVSSNSLALQAKIGLLPDVPAFYEWMNAREYLRLVGELHRLSGNEIALRSQELLKLVDLDQDSARRIGGYSRGMRQRLGVAQALMNRPQVLFLDEPTSALDPIGRREVLDLILRLKQTATIFMSTHILSDVERVCDLVGIINKGQLITISPVQAMQKKYARSTFEMEFLEDPRLFVESLKNIPWLADPQFITEHGMPLVKVRALDMAYAQKQLPALISQSGLTLTRYELSMPDLEEIFIQIINGRNSS